MKQRARIRSASSSDREAVARQFFALWPGGSLAEHGEEVADILAGKPSGTLPLVVLVAELDGAIVGFAEVGLRSHADGCDPSRLVGFLEGWYVDEEHRRRGIGRALLQAAEDWARSKGCREMASDTWLDNEPSQHAHQVLGFEVVDRCVHFRKSLS